MTTSLKIVVLGTGHVGLVTVATLASFGHTVVGFDVNDDTIAKLNAGEVHFHEPGLAELVAAGVSAGRVRFSANPAEAIGGADVAMICVGTPSAKAECDRTPCLDLSYAQIGLATKEFVPAFVGGANHPAQFIIRRTQVREVNQLGTIGPHQNLPYPARTGAVALNLEAPAPVEARQ